MPAFGKSGTLRIRDFNSSMFIEVRDGAGVLSLSDREPRVASRARDVFHVHRVDARAARSVADGALEPLERFGIAFSRDLDAAIGQVAYPAVKSFARAGRFGEKSEANALNASADQKPSREAHAEETG